MKIKSIYYYDYEKTIGFYQELCDFEKNKLRYTGMALSTAEIRVNASPIECLINERRTIEIKEEIKSEIDNLKEIKCDIAKELNKYVVIYYENDEKKYYNYDERFCCIFKDIREYSVVDEKKVEKRTDDKWNIYGEDIMLVEMREELSGQGMYNVNNKVSENSKIDTMKKNNILAVRYCRKCGHELVAESLYCNKCGVEVKIVEDLGNKKDDEQECKNTENKKNAKRKSIFKMAAVILLLVVGSIVAVGVIKEADDKKSKADKDKKHNHKWIEEQYVAPSCVVDGYTLSKCEDCGAYTKIFQDASGHVLKDGCCIKCGYTEKKHVNVEWISNRKIFHQDEENRFVLLFSLLDGEKVSVASNAIIDVRIVNDEGVELYKKSVNISPSDFSIWTTISTGEEEFKAAVFINDSEITKGSKENGKIYFTVYSEDKSFYFEESVLTVNNLPVLATSVHTEKSPCKLNRYGYDGTIYTQVRIDEISYEIIYGDCLKIYFIGEKIYDYEGKSANNTCDIKWKLYDSQGYLIDSGSLYIFSLGVGDKFRDEYIIIYDKIKHGESYTLKFENK